MARGLLKAVGWYMPILSLSASLNLVRGESIMQDMYPDTESQHELFRFAQKAVQDVPECRESRIAAAQRALSCTTRSKQSDPLTQCRSTCVPDSGRSPTPSSLRCVISQPPMSNHLRQVRGLDEWHPPRPVADQALGRLVDLSSLRLVADFHCARIGS